MFTKAQEVTTVMELLRNGGKPKAGMPMAASFDLPHLACVFLTCMTCVLPLPLGTRLWGSLIALLRQGCASSIFQNGAIG